MKMINSNCASFYPMFAKVVLFWKEFLTTLKCSFWHVERTFENPAESFRQMSNDFSLKVRNDFEFFFFKKMIFLKISPGHIECSSDNHAKVFFCFLPKKIEFFWEKIWFLFKIGRGGNFAAECKSIDFFCLFQLNFEFLEKKLRFHVWKNYKVWRRRSIFLKNPSNWNLRPSNWNLEKNWWAEKLPALAVRLVYYKMR